MCTSEPPSCSFVTSWPSARRTTGGPDANSADVPFTITLKCDSTAQPAGPPATGPSTAATLGADCICLMRGAQLLKLLGR